MRQHGQRLPSPGRQIALAACLALAVLGLSLTLFGLAGAEVIAGGNVRVTFTGRIRPRALPRGRPEPIAITVEGRVRPLAGRRPPGLRRFRVAINRHARLFTRGLAVCPRRRLRGATSGRALALCGEALVGSGHFTAHIDIPDQAPFPSAGRALIFNSSLHGRPALLGHVYGRKPVPTVQVLPFVIGHDRRPAYDITLSARMPAVGEEWGHVTGFALTLRRTYLYRGRRLSLISANCPAPEGLHLVPFKLAQGSFYLSDGSVRERLLSGSCRVRRATAR